MSAYAKKHFGQHFLHDPQVLARLVRAIKPQAGEALVEIGPGRGAMTRLLRPVVGRMIVVEIDRDVIEPLVRACGGPDSLDIRLEDALQADYSAMAPAGGQIRLVGNLPYNISTPLLFHLLDHAAAIRDMHFMLQKEVVDRICAAPGSGDYGRLTVTLAARAEAAHLFDVGPGAFNPPPKVDSAVVRLIPRPPPFEICDLAAYDRLVTAAFNQRRKTLANGLKGLLNAAQIEAVGLSPAIRAERLSPAEFARLANQLATTASDRP